MLTRNGPGDFLPQEALPFAQHSLDLITFVWGFPLLVYCIPSPGFFP